MYKIFPHLFGFLRKMSLKISTVCKIDANHENKLHLNLRFE